MSALSQALRAQVQAWIDDDVDPAAAAELSELLAAAIRMRLDEVIGRMSERPADVYTGAELLRRLPEAKTLLTPRESEVLAHVLEGGANKPIARALHISHRTVEIHRSRAMAKLGARSVTELIRRSLTTPRAEPPH